MCKVEEYNAVMRTTTQSKVYIRKMTISEEKMKQHHVTLCIETKLCVSKEMNVESRKENNTHLTETLQKAGFT